MSALVQSLARKLSRITGVPLYFLHQCQFELRMACIRFGAPWRHRRVRRLEKSGHLRLVFGCGETRYPGWLGIDCFRSAAVDLRLDLRRRLPFRDNIVDICYSEHFLEHLFPEEVERHFAEVFRVLKPGGTYRVAVPAALRFAQKYLEGDREFFALAHPWESRPFDAVRKIFSWNGEHRTIYDYSQIEHLARQAGFGQVRECRVNSSPDPRLRIDRSEAQRVAETLYAEMVKL